MGGARRGSAPATAAPATRSAPPGSRTSARRSTPGRARRATTRSSTARGAWADVEMRAIGIGVETAPGRAPTPAARIFHVWFGERRDPARAPDRGTARRRPGARAPPSPTGSSAAAATTASSAAAAPRPAAGGARRRPPGGGGAPGRRHRLIGGPGADTFVFARAGARRARPRPSRFPAGRRPDRPRAASTPTGAPATSAFDFVGARRRRRRAAALRGGVAAADLDGDGRADFRSCSPAPPPDRRRLPALTPPRMRGRLGKCNTFVGPPPRAVLGSPRVRGCGDAAGSGFVCRAGRGRWRRRRRRRRRRRSSSLRPRPARRRRRSGCCRPRSPPPATTAARSTAPGAPAARRRSTPMPRASSAAPALNAACRGAGARLPRRGRRATAGTSATRPELGVSLALPLAALGPPEPEEGGERRWSLAGSLTVLTHRFDAAAGRAWHDAAGRADAGPAAAARAARGRADGHRRRAARRPRASTPARTGSTAAGQPSTSPAAPDEAATLNLVAASIRPGPPLPWDLPEPTAG